MTLFLAVAAALALGTLFVVLRPLFARTAAVETRDQKDARLFRQQLAEVERDLERGVIRPEEAESARAEISRRLIAAAGRAETTAPAQAAPRGATGMVAGLALVGLPLLAVLAYLLNGQPGTPDLPFASRGLEPTIATATGEAPPVRPSQREAEAMVGPQEPPPAPEQQDFAKLIDQLEQVVAARGPEPQGLTLLANGYARLGRHAEAWPVFAQLIDLRGEEAPVELYALQAESMVMAANGYISPEAEQVIGAALDKDPSQPVARYYAGLLQAQQGRLEDAVITWQSLRDESPKDAPWVGPLDQMIAEAKARQSGAARPGPTAEQMDAAAEMSPEERQQMIEGMVQRLETRLTSEGGEPEEWLRLMASYAQLGRPEDARRAYALGREALGPEGGASFLRQQALVLGVIEE